MNATINFEKELGLERKTVSEVEKQMKAEIFEKYPKDIAQDMVLDLMANDYLR